MYVPFSFTQPFLVELTAAATARISAAEEASLSWVEVASDKLLSFIELVALTVASLVVVATDDDTADVALIAELASVATAAVLWATLDAELVADEATALTLTDSAETGATTVSELAADAVLETSVLLIEATTTVALVASLCTAEESLVVCETSVVAMADEATSAFAVALSKETTPAMATAAVIASVFHCFPLLYNL